jgi:hypothetical protein
MKTDKEFALDLVGWLERYTLRISILEHLLNHSGLKDWREKSARMTADPIPRAMLHQEFAVWRDTILNSPDVTTVAREILESLSRRNPES